MKRLTCFISIVLTVLSCFGQVGASEVEVEVTPVLYEPEIPTIVIDSSYVGFANIKNKGFELIDVVPQPCNEEGVYDKIGSFNDVPFVTDFEVVEIRDTVVVNYSIIANCCSDFACRIDCEEHKDRIVFQIELAENGGLCECFCCFNFTFRLSNRTRKSIKKIEFEPFLNGEEALDFCITK